MTTSFDEQQVERDTRGRFAEQAHMRSDVHLVPYPVAVNPIAFELSDDPNLPDDEYNAGGSFDYPPVPRSARQVRAFWATVHVPDVAITAYERCYAADLEQSVQEQLAAWDRTHPTKEVMLFEESNAHEAARAAAEAEFRSQRPSLPRPYLRTAVRVMRMAQDARDLPEQEREELRSSPVKFNPERNPTTVAAFQDFWGIRHPALRERALATTAELEREDIEALRREMTAAVSRLSSQISGVDLTTRRHKAESEAVWDLEDERANARRKKR
ncbi:hypothetical protein Bequi_13415 [Brachybacterium sp. JHP9]|uniref:Uncharacterized protein n=1 Tax=Brachybacterium equifaecis TaxID=2910770 RepID=A0ABT0R344_9MICO|nr:hypothetical protein [Brachybacterium equifaecis]MCL6424363.1 hypothetical protein [Brachybacterium equifaecis]